MEIPADQFQTARRIRDYAVALSLAPTPPNRAEVESHIAVRHALERKAHDHASAEAKRVLAQRLDELEREIAALEAATGGAEPDTRLVALRSERDALLMEMSRIQTTIRRKRDEYEEKAAEDELRRLDAEETETLQRIVAERLARHEAQVSAWRNAAASREVRRQRLAQLRARLQLKLEDAIERMQFVRLPFVSRTVAGFLVWAGYSAVAATGAAVAHLLNTSRDQNIVASFAESALRLARDVTGGIPGATGLLLSIVLLLFALTSVAGAVWLCDKLIHYFDKSWRKRKRSENTFSRTALGLPSPEIGRRAYVQMLAVLPFLYLSGLAVVVVAQRAGASEAAISFGQLAPAMLHSAVGSVVALLTTSIMTLYIIKIIEDPNRKDPAGRGRPWEFAVPPLMIVIALMMAMSRSQADRYVWGCLAVFMVLSSIGLAYGVVYRGIFRDVDVSERMLRTCDNDIEELDTEPELEEARSAERNDVRAVQRLYRRRRQSIRDASRKRRVKRSEARTYAPARTVSRWSMLRRFLDATPADVIAVEDWRVVDTEIASEETARRSDIQRRLVEIDHEMKSISSTPGAIEARTRLTAARAEHSATQAQLASADERAAADAARLLERQAIEIEEFRRAFEIGATVRPAFEIMRDRTEQTTLQATRYWRQAGGES